MRRLVRPLSIALLTSAAAVAQSQLELPPRGPGARSGSELATRIANLTVPQREELLWHEFASGNVPDFLRRFVTIVRTRPDALGRLRNVRYEVLPDHLALGSDADSLRMPMTPVLGQQLADALDCALPTRRLVDDIWLEAAVKLTPVTFDPGVYDILSPAVFRLHHQRIEQQRAAHPLGLLVAGTKKDVVVSARLATFAGRVAIYGWHRTNGVPIQPLYTGHVDSYADYSHGLRLVRRRVEVDGRPTTVAAVLADPVLHPLLGDEGAFTTSRYTVPPPAETVPFVDRFAVGGLALRSWRPKFTAPTLLPFSPRAPGGDGVVVAVRDPRGGTESLRCGSPDLTDQIAQADLYCDHRPHLAGDGFERIGVFVRDRAAGAFDGTQSQQGACYALTWDSHDGRLRCLRADRGLLTDLLPSPVHLRGSAWRRLRIEARGASLRFFVDGRQILAATDATHAHGEFGIGHHEFFASNTLAQGARADHWFADVPDALRLGYRSEVPGQVTVTTSRGVPGDFYFRPVTLTPGRFPNGDFYGLDGPPDLFAAQLATGHPMFVGVFDVSGRAETTVALPQGLTLFGTAIDLFGPLPPVAVSVPVRFDVR
jgi:hypothetical protein